MNLRDYFAKLMRERARVQGRRIFRPPLTTADVVRKWFGTGYQEHIAISRRLETALDYAARPTDANERRWLDASRTRNEVETLCASIGRKIR